MAELRRALDAQEDLDYRFGRPAYFSFRTPIEVEIRGFNLPLLRRLADTLTERMRAIPGIEDVKSSTEGGNPELQIRFDRTLLAKFGLVGDHVTRPTRSLSPGERTRASLALLMANGANLLVLDEPTNHLDLPAIEQLEQALDTFAGTVLLVTHDRELLDRVRITRTIRLDDGRLS